MVLNRGTDVQAEYPLAQELDVSAIFHV